jgi:signal transduction histidine kinase/CheY-like chemotaxis protein
MTGRLDLTIGQRLSMGFGLLLLLWAALLGAVLHWHGQSEDAESRYINDIAPRLDATNDVERALLLVAVEMRRHLLAPDAERLNAFYQAVANVRTGLVRLEQLGAETSEPAENPMFRYYIGRYIAEAEALVRGDFDEAARTEAELALLPLRASAVRALNGSADRLSAQGAEALTTIADLRSSVRGSLWGAALLSTILLVGLSVFTIQWVRRPIQQLIAIAGALVRGDFAPALKWSPAPADEGRPRPEPRSEMRQLAFAFGQAASALKRREERLVAEGDLARAAASSLDPATLGARALETVVRYSGSEVGVVYRAEPHTGRLAPLATHALAGSARPLESGEGIPGQAAQSLEPILLQDVPADAALQVELGYDRATTRSLAALPIAFQGELHGVLVLGSLRKALQEDVLPFLDRAALQLGVGLHNAQSHEAIRDLALTLQVKNDEIQAQNEEIHAQSEELQAQSEEIQAQNEELQAQSEELQAQSEELQAQSEELQSQNEELLEREHELRSRSNELALADERKNEFLALLAHELRNPMAAISTSLTLVQRSAPGSHHANRALAVIERQTRHLARLVDDLLDVTRVSNGKIQVRRERLDIVDVLRHCVEDQRPEIDAQEAHVALVLPTGPVWVEGDHTRLCQIVGNLLSNAVKFSGRNGHIELRLEEEPATGSALVTVTDDGVGMEPELLPELFHPFSQGSTTLDRSGGGLGLGLALVKGLVEIHGGTVEAHSDGPEQGAEFRVRLPLLPASEPDLRPHEPQRQTSPPRHILLVEDNLDAASSLRDVLELEGHRVELATTGPEGLEKVRASRPEVVLCDVGLPGMDGYAVARTIRSDPELRGILLVALTGYAGPEERELSARAGFDAHLAKPADLEHLTALLALSPGSPLPPTPKRHQGVVTSGRYRGLGPDHEPESQPN